MTNTALDLSPRPEIASLLEEEFSDASLDRLLGLDASTVPWNEWNEALYGPLAEFLARPGKEMRARLVTAAWQLAGGQGEPPRELPLIVEALHAGSLIIDDIEDGSAYRRGGPALHVTHGLPTALNAGCWLYFWPHALLERLELHPTTELAARRVISRTLLRAHQGQALDLSVCVHDLAQGDVPGVTETTTRLKTGALVRLATELGALCAAGPREATNAIARFGMEVGVGLQMADDLGGLVSERRCHKGHEDLILARATWPWAWAAELLDPRRYAELVGLGREVTARDTHPEILGERLRARVEHTGRRRIRARFDAALAGLHGCVADTDLIDAIAHDLTALEASYV